MPSIANQDFKIYGLLGKTAGIPARYCAELMAAIVRRESLQDEANIADAYVIASTEDSVCRMLGLGVFYDYEGEEFVQVSPTHRSAAYYDALWAIQQAVYASVNGDVLAEDTKFDFNPEGVFIETGYGATFVNEDGYLIKGTAADGKLASLYLGDKAEELASYAVVRLESLLPLVGELPLDTTEIW